MRPFIMQGGMVLSGLLLLGACGGSPRVAAPQTASTDVNAFLQEVLAAEPVLAYDDLVEALGSPVRVKAEPMAGANGALPPDTLRTVSYYGLEVALQEGGSPSRLAHLALTDARYTAPEGLRVGYAESEVLNVLGRPTRREAARLIYEKERPQACVLVVFLERRTISRMEWRFAY